MSSFEKGRRLTIAIALLASAIVGGIASVPGWIMVASHERYTQERPHAGQHGTDNTISDALSPPSLADLLTGYGLQQDAAYCSAHPNSEADQWIVSYWCSAKRTDVYSATASTVLAFITIVLVGTGFLQYFIYRDIRQDALIINRAFVSMHTIEHRWYPDPAPQNGLWHQLVPIWTNAGNTPTRDLRITVNFDLCDDELPADFGFPDKDNCNDLCTLAPKATLESRALLIPGCVLAAIKRGEKQYFLWGRAEYNDTFRYTKPHVTKFCYRISFVVGDPERRVDEFNQIRITFITQARHNCVDDECLVQGLQRSHDHGTRAAV